MDDVVKEKMWKILRGETTLKEGMGYLSYSEGEISDKMGEIEEEDRNDSMRLFSTSLFMRLNAYNKLRSFGEIPLSNMYHLSSNKFLDFDEKDPTLRHGDIGIMGEMIYIYYPNTGWIKWKK